MVGTTHDETEAAMMGYAASRAPEWPRDGEEPLDDVDDDYEDEPWLRDEY